LTREGGVADLGPKGKVAEIEGNGERVRPAASMACAVSCVIGIAVIRKCDPRPLARIAKSRRTADPSRASALPTHL
jgi:hypothetical protein